MSIQKDGGYAQHHPAALDPVFPACMAVLCCSDARVGHQVNGVAHVSTPGSRHAVAAIQDPCQSQSRRCYTLGMVCLINAYVAHSGCVAPQLQPVK